jgi:nucleotide-binding universal stress UspA family protein
MALIQTILVPIDFSEHSAAALGLATELAKSTDAALHLVHVDDFIAYTLPNGAVIYDAMTLAGLREDMRQRLLGLQAGVQKAGIARVQTTVLEGQPDVEIVRHAGQLPADLIIIGTHGRRGFSHLMLGSVAERVARKACCPVIAVPLARRTSPSQG